MTSAELTSTYADFYLYFESIWMHSERFISVFWVEVKQVLMCNEISHTSRASAALLHNLGVLSDGTLRWDR